MKGFGVVHTETNYINEKNLIDGRPRNEILFDRIAGEIGKQLESGSRVYLMAEQAKSPDSELIYSGIRQYSREMVFVPYGGALELQLLSAKELWLRQGVEKGELAGVSYFQCVRDFYLMFSGEMEKEYLQWAQEILGWPDKKFDEIVGERIDVSVREELTEKPFVGLGKEILRFLM